MAQYSPHAPVLLEEVITLLVVDPQGVYVDCTLGGGGHAEAICEQLTGEGRLVGLDADADAIHAAKKRLSVFGDRVTLMQANFRDLQSTLDGLGIARIHGVLLDLGVSSHQLDEGARGFSYRSNARLDMRMDHREQLSAYDVVNTYSEEELERVIAEFGEERHARRITRRIIAARPVETTADLKAAVSSVIGGRFLTKSLARVFQGIRMEVNQELGSLSDVLRQAVPLLVTGGRMVVISYHSLEDRIVKHLFRSRSHPAPDASIRILTKKPLYAREQEIAVNPRARSAKLRAAERLELL